MELVVIVNNPSHITQRTQSSSDLAIPNQEHVVGVRSVESAASTKVSSFFRGIFNKKAAASEADLDQQLASQASDELWT